ncbi:MAG: D-alanine--D-alanine ligase [Sedimentisphaerales bacterium]|nr:D-alanine--D-alanine ligase [Sedimentisphaerales bacterium]
MKSPAILVLCGGPGGERPVSLQSGWAVAAALARAGYRVRQADIAPDNLAALNGRDYQIVFPVLHGAFGEDGQLQAILEARQIPYAGSDSASSRLAMDKYLSKVKFTQAGLLCPLAERISRLQRATLGRRRFDWLIEYALERIGLPCVIKPNAEGSSLGIQIAANIEQAWQAVRLALRRYGDILIERYIAGREMTVGILDGRALPVLEIRPKQLFYDYQAKYLDQDTEYRFDIDLEAPLLQRLQDEARTAFRALGCRDFARVDFLVDHLGRSFVLEINTIPGFTDHSLLPKAAGQAGIGMEQMCDQIVRLAARRTI